MPKKKDLDDLFWHRETGRRQFGAPSTTVEMAARTGPPGYGAKYFRFIDMCETLKGIVEHAVVVSPEDMGDNYAELVESLSQLADVGLPVKILKRSTARRTLSDRPAAPDVGEEIKLPSPDAALVESGNELLRLGSAALKHLAINPIYAGIGSFPRTVTDAQWIAVARTVLAEDGPEQFLVNMLFALRQTLGNVESEGRSPSL